MQKKIVVDALGNRLYKKVDIRVYTPDGSRFSKCSYRTPSGFGVTMKDLLVELKSVVAQAEQAYPGNKYEIVPTSDRAFNIVRKAPQIIC